MQNPIVVNIVSVVVLNIFIRAIDGGQFCPYGGVQVRSTCVLNLTSAEKPTWRDARQNCEKRNASLLIVKDIDFLRELVRTAALIQDQYWVGARKLKSWYWLNDTKPIGWYKWAPGEPNDLKGGENRLNMMSKFSYDWNDEQDTRIQRDNAEDRYRMPAGAICQFDGPCRITHENTTYPRTTFQNKTCFLLIKSNNDWNTSQNMCQNTFGHPGYLARIDDLETHEFLVKFINESGYKANYWLGGWWNRSKKSIFWWLNGASVEDDLWAPHQSSATGECAQIVKSSNYSLWAQTCDHPGKHFLCEYALPCPDPAVGHSIKVSESTTDLRRAHFVCAPGYRFNSSTSFTIECLPDGKWNSSVGCQNINECSKESPCSPHAACVDTDGSYICTCKSGYTGDGYNCNDIDECKTTNNCSSSAICTNTNGGYTCSCNSGYTCDGYNCNDIDECQTTNNCSSLASCTNTNGGYTCSCNSGYNGDGYNCNEIDECQTTNNCSSSASCTNTNGGYTCSCNSGYTGDGYNCYDIDECQTTKNCSSLAICTNTNGGYTCTCQRGFIGDGHMCSINSTSTRTEERTTLSVTAVEVNGTTSVINEDAFASVRTHDVSKVWQFLVTFGVPVVLLVIVLSLAWVIYRKRSKRKPGTGCHTESIYTTVENPTYNVTHDSGQETTSPVNTAMKAFQGSRPFLDDSMPSPTSSLFQNTTAEFPIETVAPGMP